MTTIQIKHRHGGEVLYECDTPEGMESGLIMRHALEKAAAAKADLSHADLSDADLRYADLGEGKKLVGARPVLTLGPIGSRHDYTTAYLTEFGVYVRAGCFFDTLDLFVDAVLTMHGDNKHGREYLAAAEVIKAHAAIWMPEKEVQP